jgi:ribosomal protein S18 acetylase RimI-like enzyme
MICEVHELDNVVWHSLTGPNERLAQRVGGAARFDPAVSVFASIEDEPTQSSWDDLGRVVGPDGSAILFRARVEAPSNWAIDWKLTGLQMVAADGRGEPAEGAVQLTVDDVPQMMRLVTATEPGPFRQRTIELGRYIGVRRDGELVAMAGERMHLDRYCEISAVCTDERYRRQGLAEALVGDVAAAIRSRGQIPMLHVAEGNVAAIKLYEHIGFEIRAQMTIVEARPR